MAHPAPWVRTPEKKPSIEFSTRGCAEGAIAMEEGLGNHPSSWNHHSSLPRNWTVLHYLTHHLWIRRFGGLRALYLPVPQTSKCEAMNCYDKLHEVCLCLRKRG